MAVCALWLIQCLALGREFPGASTNRQEGAAVEKGIVILVEFPDVKHNVTRDQVYTRFSEHLNSYVKQMSYNTLSLEIDVTRKWHTMPDSISRYRISPRNLEVDKSRVRKLIVDAINAADEEVDFSEYTFAVVYMGAQVMEYGMVGLCGYPGMLGWRTSDVLNTQSGQVIRGGIAIFTYQAHVGTLFHDIAHILGGVKDGKRMVPCLYDHDLQAKPGPLRETAVDAMVNMGFWDPMSCHYYQRGIPPPGICSWTKMRLNWIDQSQVKIIQPGETAEFILGPLEVGASKILVAKIPISRTTYYLIENRQPIGCDRILPGHGVLIMYADDDIPECRHGKAPVKLMNANPSVPHLEGAAFDVGGNDAFVDKQNRITIQLKEKSRGSYRIVVSPLQKDDPNRDAAVKSP